MSPELRPCQGLQGRGLGHRDSQAGGLYPEAIGVELRLHRSSSGIEGWAPRVAGVSGG